MKETSLRVLLLLHGFPPELMGGTELYGLASALALRERGVEVGVLTGSMESRPRPQLVEDAVEGIPVFRIHRQGLFLDNWDKSYAPEVEALFEDVLTGFRPDIVHVHHWVRLTRTLVRAAHVRGYPSIVTLHDAWTTCPRCFRIREGSFCDLPLSVASCLDCVPRDPWHEDPEIEEEIELFRADLRQEIALARCIIVPSEAQRGLMARHLKLQPDRLRLLPHGALVTFGRAPAPESEDAVVRLGHWGHLDRMKGFHLLLEAAGSLHEALRSRLRIECWGEASDAAYRDELEQRAQGLDVRWHGRYRPEDLAEESLHWAVIPSLAHESYSFVLDEAFALGCPVIASDRGALGERVAGAGLKFEPENAAALAAVLRRILTEPGLAAACRAQIPELVPMARHAELLEEIYREHAGWGVPGKLPDGCEELEERHRIQRSFRLEERTRQLMETLGVAERERVRADGLVGEFAKVEDTATGLHAALERIQAEYRSLEEDRDLRVASLETSLREHRAQLDTVRSEYAELAREREQQLGELSRSVDEHAALLERTRLERDRFQEETETLGRALADDRVVIAGLEEQIHAQRRTGEVSLRREGKLKDELAAVQASQEVDGSRRTDLERRLADQEGLAAAEAARRAEAEEAHADVVRALAAQAEDARGQRDRMAQLEGEIVALHHRAVADEEAARRVLLASEATVAELGVAQGRAGGRPQDRLVALLGAIVPLMQDSRSLVREMKGSVDSLAREAATLEEERTRIETRLDDLLAQQEARRGGRWLRWAGRLVGTRPHGSNGAGAGLRILMVIHDFLPRHPAGSEIYTYRLAKALGAHHSVRVVTTEAHPGVHSYHVKETSYEGLPVTEISHQHTTPYFEKTWRDPQMDLLWERILDRHRPDVVHIQHLTHHSIGYVALAKARGIPVVYTLHEYMLLCPRGGQMMREDLEICERPIAEKCADCIAHLSLDEPPVDDGRASLGSRVGRHLPRGMKQRLKTLLAAAPDGADAAAGPGAASRARAIENRLESIKDALTGVDLFISPSRFLRQKFIDCGMIEADRIIYSDNGQDLTPFQKVRHTPSPHLRIGYIGTVSDFKGVDVLVEAMNALGDLSDLQCHIHGCLNTFPAFASDLQARSRHPGVRFQGRYAPDAVGRVLGDLDVLVVPSRWYENSPLTIHEAFMAGVPVVASRLGGMAEFVEDGRNGLLFTVGDPHDLAGVLRRLHDDRGLLARLRSHSGNIKDIEEDARDMEARYKALVAGTAVTR